jgi:DUF1680 family protein
MMLYEIVPNPEYIQAAEKIVELFPSFGQFHSHSYLNTLVGVAMLYQFTGKSKYLNLIMHEYWQKITKRSVLADGSICEWFPRDHRTEGCSLTDWIRLNLKMWEITGEAVYIDAAERTWLNGLNFHQTSNGVFGHATTTPDGYAADYSEAWWCCLMHGLFAYAEIVDHIANMKSGHFWLNFFTPAIFTLNDYKLNIQTSYPVKGKILLKPGIQGTRIIHLRIPAWTDRFDVKLNEKSIRDQGVLLNGYFTINRVWQKDDRLELNLPIDLRVEDQNGNSLLDLRNPGTYTYHSYIFHGPLILGMDKKFNRHFAESLVFSPGENYHHETMAGLFIIGGSHYKIPGIENGKRTQVILNPICEQTGYWNWSDELLTFKRNGEEPIKRSEVRIRHQIKFVKN